MSPALNVRCPPFGWLGPAPDPAPTRRAPEGLAPLDSHPRLRAGRRMAVRTQNRMYPLANILFWKSDTYRGKATYTNEKLVRAGYFSFPAHYELVRKMHSCGLNRCVPVGTHGGVGGRQANYSLASYPIVQHKARKSILCHIFPFSKIFECCSDLGFSYSCFLPFKTAHWNRKRSNLSHWKFPFL